jgi:hypothetical protein
MFWDWHCLQLNAGDSLAVCAQSSSSIDIQASEPQVILLKTQDACFVPIILRNNSMHDEYLGVFVNPHLQNIYGVAPGRKREEARPTARSSFLGARPFIGRITTRVNDKI